MRLHELANAPDFETFLSAVEQLVGGEIFVVSPDLGQLRPMRPGTTSPNSDSNVLDALLGGDSAISGDLTLTPLMSRSFPLLVAAVPTVHSDGELDRSDTSAVKLVGLIADFQRTFFDHIEARRRPIPLTAAAQLQWSLLPVQAARTARYEVAGSLHPAESVAGDAYDFAVNERGNLTALVMDAMGHGVTATLSTSLALAAVRTVRRAGGSLVDQVTAADRAILDEYRGDRFVTAVVIEFTDDNIFVVNAGHEPIRRLNSDGTVISLDIPADPPLGLDGPTDYRLRQLPRLEANEGLALLSDGAIEAANPSGTQFGPDAVNAALAELRTPNSLQTANRFGNAVLKFVGADLNDDLTAVIVQTRLS